MRKYLVIATLAALAFGLRAAEDEKPWKYVDALDLRIINKGWDNTLRPYTRIPATLKDSVRPDLWERAQCSSGIGVRFATNSSRIGVRYNLLWNTHLIHMADTGLKGTDLYILEGDSVWRHVNTNRPYIVKGHEEEKLVESVYISNVDTTRMQEYMVYFPLYDGIMSLDIKVDSTATIIPGSEEIISPENRIVAYGTSILQGGCASRTGMAPTNIIGRELNCEVVNLGISGEGKMDPCMAREMVKIPAKVFLIDPVPNCTEQMCRDLTYDFVKILLEGAPDAAVVMLEGPMYPYARYDSYFGKYLPEKNRAFRENYEKLKADYPDARLYYLESDGLDGPEDDGTVDGIHLTDLGFCHYADKLVPVLRPLLSQK